MSYRRTRSVPVCDYGNCLNIAYNAWSGRSYCQTHWPQVKAPRSDPYAPAVNIGLDPAEVPFCGEFCRGGPDAPHKKGLRCPGSTDPADLPMKRPASSRARPNETGRNNPNGD